MAAAFRIQGPQSTLIPTSRDQYAMVRLRTAEMRTNLGLRASHPL